MFIAEHVMAVTPAANSKGSTGEQPIEAMPSESEATGATEYCETDRVDEPKPA